MIKQQPDIKHKPVINPNSWLGYFGKPIQEFTDEELLQVTGGAYPQ